MTACFKKQRNPCFHFIKRPGDFSLKIAGASPYCRFMKTADQFIKLI